MTAQPVNLHAQSVMNETASAQAGSDNIVPLSDTHHTAPHRTTPNEKPGTNLATPFRHAGQLWTISRRNAQPEAVWYLTFTRDKVRYRLSLHTTSLPHAKAEARAVLDRWLAGQRAPKRQNIATLAQIFAAVPQLAIRASAKGRDQYIWATQWVLKRALNRNTDYLDAQPASILNAATARAFFVSVLQEANQLPTQAAQNKFKRTALQIFSFSCALFATAAVESMKQDRGLDLPDDFTGWRNGSRVGAAMLNPGDASEWSPPSDDVLRRALVEWVKLGRTPGYIIPAPAGHDLKGYAGKPLPEWLRRNIFIAIGLELACGLRKSEVAKARWNWWQQRNGAPRLHEGDVAVKNSSNTISVRPVDPYWHILNSIVDRNGWRPAAPGDTVLAQRPKVPGKYERAYGLQFSHGGKSDRLYWPFLHVGYLLRHLGFTTQKTNHALRDWTASLITMKYGLERASQWCRHGQISTTQTHYSRFVNDDDMDDPKRLAWLRWAK